MQTVRFINSIAFCAKEATLSTTWIWYEYLLFALFRTRVALKTYRLLYAFHNELFVSLMEPVELYNFYVDTRHFALRLANTFGIIEKCHVCLTKYLFWNFAYLFIC